MQINGKTKCFNILCKYCICNKVMAHDNLKFVKYITVFIFNFISAYPIFKGHR